MHRDDRSGSCRSLSPPFASASIITVTQRSTKSTRRSVLFVLLCRYNFEFCGYPRCAPAANQGKLFSEKTELWLQIIQNTRQRQSSIHLLNNVDTCSHAFGYQRSCSGRWPPVA